MGVRSFMNATRTRHVKVAATVAIAACVAGAAAGLHAQRSPTGTIAIGSADLAGVVTGSRGPEAGVWVIAETTDLPTRFGKMVVTDDRGRYLIPDLPKATYSVWARGYGLVDSPKVKTASGTHLNLTAVVAPSAAAAAEYYPGVYWYAMLQIPPKSEFPGTGQNGNGIQEVMKTQPYWIDTVKNSCQSCHALGSKGIRTIPTALGPAENSVEAWRRRLQAGQASSNMAVTLGRLGPKKALALFADWTDRIAAGELPFAKPQFGRRAWSATSSSACGSGPRRRPICTMRSRATSAIRTRERQRPHLRVARGEHRHGAGARSATRPRPRR